MTKSMLFERILDAINESNKKVEIATTAMEVTNIQE
jgi:hypothetical protein